MLLFRADDLPRPLSLPSEDRRQLRCLPPLSDLQFAHHGSLLLHVARLNCACASVSDGLLTLVR